MDAVDRALGAAREEAQADIQRRDALMKRVRFTTGVKWVFKPDDMLWHGTNGERLSWDALAPRVADYEEEQEELEARKQVMNAIIRQTPEQLAEHLRMCRLSLDIAKEMGLA